MNNNPVFPNNENLRSNEDSLKKYTVRKSQQFYNTMNENNKSNNNKSKKSLDLLLNSNFLTQYNSIDNNSMNKNIYRDNNDNLSYIKHEKYKTYISTNNKCKLENTNEIIKQKTMNNEEINNNMNNKEDNKEKTIKKISFKKIKTLKKFNLDSLQILRNKRNEKNKLELEHQKQKVHSPSIIIPNKTIIGNKIVIKDFLNINKKNKKNNAIDKNSGILDDLIKDFLNFNNNKKISNKLNNFHYINEIKQ